MKKRSTSGDWIIDARELICRWFGTEANRELAQMKNNADMLLIERVAGAMNTAYKEAARRGVISSAKSDVLADFLCPLNGTILYGNGQISPPLSQHVLAESATCQVWRP